MKLLNELYTVNLLTLAVGVNVCRHGEHMNSGVNELSARPEGIRRSDRTKTGTTTHRRQPLLLGLVDKDSLFCRSLGVLFFLDV